MHIAPTPPSVLSSVLSCCRVVGHWQGAGTSSSPELVPGPDANVLVAPLGQNVQLGDVLAIVSDLWDAGVHALVRIDGPGRARAHACAGVWRGTIAPLIPRGRALSGCSRHRPRPRAASR